MNSEAGEGENKSLNEFESDTNATRCKRVDFQSEGEVGETDKVIADKLL